VRRLVLSLSAFAVLRQSLQMASVGAGPSDRKLATGDAVNVTVRLEAAASAHEIYLGETTYRRVRDAVDVEAVEPLTLNGKSQPVPAFRLLRVKGEDGNERRHDTPAVGREAELAALMGAVQAALLPRRAQWVTVVGDAGVGKSRMARAQRRRDHCRPQPGHPRCTRSR